MTICYVKLTQGYFGGEKQTIDLLLAHRALGDSAVLVALPNSALAKEANRRGITVYPFALFPYPKGRLMSLVYLLLFPIHLFRAILLVHSLKLREQVSVACLQEPYEKILFGLVLGWRKVRVFWLEVISWEPFLTQNSVLFPLIVWLARRATGIIVTSDHLAREVRKYVHDRPLIVAKHGLANVEREQLARLRQTPSHPIIRIGFIGNLHRLKGIFVLIDAWQQLIGRYPSLQLTYAGAGADQVGLSKAIEVRGLAKTVRIVGYMPAATFFKSIDLLVLPTLHENLPYVIQEAVYAKVPVVASRIGGIPELVPTTQALVKPNDPTELARGIEWWLGQTKEQVSRLVSDNQRYLDNQVSFERYFTRIERAYQS